MVSLLNSSLGSQITKRLPSWNYITLAGGPWFIISSGVEENGSPLHTLDFFSTIICHDFTASIMEIHSLKPQIRMQIKL